MGNRSITNRDNQSRLRNRNREKAKKSITITFFIKKLDSLLFKVIHFFYFFYKNFKFILQIIFNNLVVENILSSLILPR